MSTRVFAEEPDQEGVYAVLFDACMGYHFGLGSDYTDVTSLYAIQSDGLCVGEDHPAIQGTDLAAVPPGMRVCEGDAHPRSFQARGATPDATHCIWYESWAKLRLAEMAEQQSFERTAIHGAESEQMTISELVDYYENSVLPWWEELSEFAADANVPAAYEEVHRLIGLSPVLGVLDPVRVFRRCT